MTERDERPRDLDRDLDEMQQRSERLEEEIEGTRDDWERKKRDPSVPGAAGDPPPEQGYPSKGD